MIQSLQKIWENIKLFFEKMFHRVDEEVEEIKLKEKEHFDKYDIPAEVHFKDKEDKHDVD
jgi:hypothetical protein